MKHIFLCSIFFINACLYAQDSSRMPISMDSLFSAKAKESIGKSFPDFSANFHGRQLIKDSLKGKVVFINFWFEACPPCVAELPALNELYKKLIVQKNFRFISFTYETPHDIILLKKKHNIKYPVASVTRQECYRLNQNNGFPTSIILDKNGIIKYLFTGGTTDSNEAAKLISSTVYKDILTTLSN